MGQKSKKQIIKDLTKAGVSKEMAKKLAEGASLKGKKAKEFLKVIVYHDTLYVVPEEKSCFRKFIATRVLNRSPIVVQNLATALF